LFRSPATGSMWCVKVGATPPCCRNVPSCTERTRSTAGSYVMVRLIVESRCAPTTEIGTVYGPPPTWNVGPGVVTVIRAVGPGGGAGLAVACGVGVGVPGCAGGTLPGWPGCPACPGVVGCGATTVGGCAGSTPGCDSTAPDCG